MGADAEMLVQRKEAASSHVIGPSGPLAQVWSRARPVLDQIPVRRYRERGNAPFSPNILPSANPWRRTDVDLVNLHWVNAGFVSPATVERSSIPIVWTLHDMWAFTGGCHYTEGCDRFRTGCGACPILGSGDERDLSSHRLQAKARAFAANPITFVTPSSWLAEAARSSHVLEGQRVEVIPNGIDTTVFKPLDRALARSAFNLDETKVLIGFGAANPLAERRKGSVELLTALEAMATMIDPNSVELVVFGGTDGAPPSTSFPIRFIGHLSDEVSLALLYSALDMCVVPSLQENFANIVLEAMACGTPVVAFDTGGFPEAVTHGKHGLLAKPFEPVSLAEQMAELAGDEAKRTSMGAAARERTTRQYGLERMAGSYLSLFESVR